MSSRAKTVVILKADLLYARALAEIVRTALPGSTIRTVRSVPEASAALAQCCDLFLASADAAQGDVLDLLLRERVARGRVVPVLLLAGPDDERTAAAAEALSIEGILDPESDGADMLAAALCRVAAGLPFRSAAHARRPAQSHRAHPSRVLTAGEQLFFAIIGDGCDDRVAANALGVSRHTVSTVRRELHRKLGVQHRGELVRVAVQHGFVRFTPGGVLRPGLALLAAAYHDARAKRVPRHAKVVHLSSLHRTADVRCA